MTPPTTRNFFALSAIQLNQTIPPLKKEKTARGTVKARPKTNRAIKPVIILKELHRLG
jgi:hypothetical protein